VGVALGVALALLGIAATLGLVGFRRVLAAAGRREFNGVNKNVQGADERL